MSKAFSVWGAVSGRIHSSPGGRSLRQYWILRVSACVGVCLSLTLTTRLRAQTDVEFNHAADSNVKTLAVQGDGKILAGGYFKTLDGQSRNYLGRLNADGTLDESFNPGANDR